MIESSYDYFCNFPDIEDEEEINISASDYINRMFDSQIWYSHDHGGKSRIYFYNKIDSDVEMTAIGPYATREPEDESEETAAVWVNVSGIAEQNENLNKLQLAIINACSTGADDGNTLDSVLSMEENIKKITIADNQETLILDNVSSSEDTANGYNTYWGSDGNLYGYYSDNKLYFYAMNHRTDKYGNTVVNKSKVMEVAIDFLYDVGYGGGNYDYSCSNNYSKEFIIDFKPSSEVVVEGLISIRMILENDSNGNPKVTFFKANRD